MRAFQRAGDECVALLAEPERRVFAMLMEATREVLAPDVELTGDPFEDLVAGIGPMGDDAQPSGRTSDRTDSGQQDPALARLLPTAHKGDDATAAEFRRLTEQGLRQRKCANLDLAVRVMLQGLDELDVDEEVDLVAGDEPSEVVHEEREVRVSCAEAPALLTALTDVRLLLGERLGIRTDEDATRLEMLAARLSDDDPRLQLLVWYDVLAWLQTTLVDALMRTGDEPYDPAP